MDQNTLNFIYFLAAIGGIWIVIHFSLLVWSLIRTLFPRLDHLNNYGQNSWALVTGASDGIGLAFCKQLAKTGFNVCLVARNPKKLSDVETEIKEEYPHVETKVIVADFSKSQEKYFFQRIRDEVRTIDVSLLVNNVGICNTDEFHRLGTERIIEEINVNCVSSACLTSVLLPGMMQRPLRSGIINVSSFLGTTASPYLSNYSGTKGYVNMLSKGINLELEDKIDVLCVQPMFVETKMSQQANRFDVISAEDCARSSLDKLGLDSETEGHWRHRFIAWLAGGIPKSIIAYNAKKTLRESFANKTVQQR